MPATAAPPNMIRTAISHIPEDMRRLAADTMSDRRADVGPDQADKLENTAPEDRTWVDGLVALGWGATDFLDGLLTEDLPPSAEGREKDRRGDRDFVMPQQEVLSANGEVPEIHHRLKVGRESAMKGLRYWGAQNGKSLKSLQVNRFKTVAEMGTLAAAQSPLSQKEELIRWGASIGTGASLTGLFETAFQYMQKDDADPEESEPTARNSAAREMSAGPRDRIASFIDRRFPGITPSHITRAGELMVESSALMAAVSPDHPALPTAMYTVGSLFDTLDGALARLKGLDGTDGMIEDVQADLRQQIVTLGALSVIAMRRGNRVAAANYAAAAMTMPLSALTRAQAESKGLIVAEGGMGTRVGRGIMGGVGMGFNRHQDASDIVSSTLAVSIINTVHERQHVIAHGEDSPYCVGVSSDQELMDDAKLRQQAILPYAAAGIALGAVLLAGNQTRAVEALIGLSRSGVKVPASEGPYGAAAPAESDTAA